MPVDKNVMPPVELDSVERAYVRRAVELLTQSVGRANQKEVPGSEIHGARVREISMLEELRKKF